MEVGESADQTRNVAARGLHFDRHGNRVLVVLHAKNYWQAAVGGGVQRLPEFAFAGRAIAERNVSDFIALKLDVLELAVIAVGFLASLGMPGEIAAGFGASDRLQNLGARGRRLGDNIEPLVGPVRRHLTSAGAGIVGRTHGAKQHFIRRCAQRKTQRAIAVIGIEPVVAGLQHKGCGDAHGFVSRAGDLEEDLLLALEQDLAVVHAPRGEHDAVRVDELLTRQTLISLGLFRKVVFVLGIDFDRGHAAFFTPPSSSPASLYMG